MRNKLIEALERKEAQMQEVLKLYEEIDDGIKYMDVQFGYDIHKDNDRLINQAKFKESELEIINI